MVDEVVAIIQGLSDIQHNNHVRIGIKRMGELDRDVFVNELEMRMPPGEIVIKAVELCTLWEEKIKDPQWYPFKVTEDDKGKPQVDINSIIQFASSLTVGCIVSIDSVVCLMQRSLKEDDLTLQSLKEEWGIEIHDVVVEALTEIQEHNPSGCYMVPELWNFSAKRKASLDEVIRAIFELQAVKAKPRTQPRKTLKG